MNKNKKILVVLAFLIVSLVSVASYAYFVATVTGNNLANNNVIKTGHMAVEYIDGNTIGTTTNMMPGDYIEKHFSVKNTGTLETIYNIYLNDVINNFNTKSDLVYELISDNGVNINQTTCPETNDVITSNVSIGVGVTHTYTLKITFKNVDRNQDDNKGKTFSAQVDILEKKVRNIANQIIELKENGASDLEYDGVSSLGTNGTIDDNLRYVGLTPNNYVYFNCDTTDPSQMNDTTCEKWRIVGVMNNIEDDNGNSQSRVKIMRSESLRLLSWDVSNNSNNGWGINQWGESTFEDGTPYEGADIMRELNYDYLGNIVVGTDDAWYGYEGKYYEMPSKLMTSNSINMIQDVKWNTGTIDEVYDDIANSNNPYKLKASSLYSFERSNNNGKMCVQGTEYCDDNVIRTTSWIGKIGLIYPSDFGYSTSGGLNLNKTSCLNLALSSWGDFDISNVSECRNNSWIHIGSDSTIYYDYFISPSVGYATSSHVFTISATGNLISAGACDDSHIRPSLYLKNSVKIDSGNGSESNPYKLTM